MVLCIPAAAQHELLEAYHHAYEALVADDLASWQQATLAMQQAVAAIDWPARFPRVLSALNAGAEEIEAVSELTEARALFYRHNLGLLRFAELGCWLTAGTRPIAQWHEMVQVPVGFSAMQCCVTPILVP